MEKERFIPEGWREVKIKDISDVIMGQSPSSIYYNTEGDGLPLIQGNADIDKRKSIIRLYTSKLTKICERGDLIMSVRAPVGAVAKASYKSCLGRGVCAFTNSNDFLYHYFVYIEDDWGKYSKGSIFESINSEDLCNFHLILPTSLSEQQQIASILSAADSAIEQTENLIEKYKNIKKGLMQDLLNPKEGWKKVKLEEVGEVVTGPFGSALHEKDYTDTGTPIVNPQNIVEGSIIAIEECLVNDETVERLKKYKLETGNIIIARRGEMGRCAIVERHQEGWLCGTGCFIIKVNSKKINPHFLYLLLSSDKTKQILENNSIGSTMHNLNQKILYDLDCVIPDIIEQKQIVTILSTINHQLQTLEASLKKQREQKLGLMDDLLTGRVRVTKLLNN